MFIFEKIKAINPFIPQTTLETIVAQATDYFVAHNGETTRLQSFYQQYEALWKEQANNFSAARACHYLFNKINPRDSWDSGSTVADENRCEKKTQAMVSLIDYLLADQVLCIEDIHCMLFFAHKHALLLYQSNNVSQPEDMENVIVWQATRETLFKHGLFAQQTQLVNIMAPAFAPDKAGNHDHELQNAINSFMAEQKPWEMKYHFEAVLPEKQTITHKKKKI